MGAFAFDPVDGLAHMTSPLMLALLAPFVGSFLGVVVMRLPAGGAILVGRSSCTSCGARLGVVDLVPLLSWLGLGGRCRHCGAPQGSFYPAIELGALAIALWAALQADERTAWVSCVLGWTLLALAAIDSRHLVLSDELTLPLVPAGLLVAWSSDPQSLPDHLIGAVAGFLALWLVRALYRRLRGREGLGLGDAKLLAAAGAWVSWTGLPSVLLLAAWFALAWVTLRAWRGTRVGAHDALAFGPHLCLAIWLVWLYGPLAAG